MASSKARQLGFIALSFEADLLESKVVSFAQRRDRPWKKKLAGRWSRLLASQLQVPTFAGALASPRCSHGPTAELHAAPRWGRAARATMQSLLAARHGPGARPLDCPVSIHQGSSMNITSHFAAGLALAAACAAACAQTPPAVPASQPAAVGVTPDREGCQREGRPAPGCRHRGSYRPDGCRQDPPGPA